MKKLLLGMGYLTWFCCNLAVLYGLGLGTVKLCESTSVGNFLLLLAAGMVMLMILIILSILCLCIVILFFGDDEEIEKLDDVFDKMNL